MTEIELVGNALCLDFTNTVNARPAARRDWLRTAGEAMTWARSTGHPIHASAGLEAALPEVRELRDTVHRVFQPLAHAEDPARDDLDALVTTYSQGVAHTRLADPDPDGGGDDDGGGGGGVFMLGWPEPRTPLVLRWEVAASAIDLLTRGPLDRLGECPSCGWLFLDTSKNRRRRWCSMATCGSRDKARRYYASHAVERGRS